MVGVFKSETATINLGLIYSEIEIPQNKYKWDI